MDKNVETNYYYDFVNVLCMWRGMWGKKKNQEILKLTKILSWSVLNGELFHSSQRSSNPWLP